MLLKTGLRFLLSIVIVSLASAQADNLPNKPQYLSIQLAKLADKTFNIEIAQSPEQQKIGLMHRRTMPPNNGMLFLYRQANILCFWMKNTHIPLSLAYLDTNSRIVEIIDMQPLSLTSHCSKQPVIAALEMPQGWFSRNQISLGLPLQLFNKDLGW